jgi:hypothetical protein
MENILREYEARLLDSNDGVILIAPVIAASEQEARVVAAALAARETAARFVVRPQMGSRQYAAGKPAVTPGN